MTDVPFHAYVERSSSGSMRIVLDSVAAGTVADALSETRDLLLAGQVTTPDTPADEFVDPFDAIVAGFSASSDATTPDDPVLLRLLPDGVQGDDEAAAEFRSATEAPLRQRKVAALDIVISDLERLRDGDQHVAIDPPRLRAWLTGLNDGRLALGAMLDINSESDLMAELDEYLDNADSVAPGDDERTLRAYRILVYDLLTELQARLVAAMP